MNYQYSEKELQMFRELGVLNTENERIILKQLPPNMLFYAAAKKCFVEKLDGKAVESLRRCIIAIDEDDQEKRIYRLTTEFDDLIEL